MSSTREQAPSGIRTFSTGATRNSDHGKYDYDGFLSPLAIEAFGAYMHFNRHLDDGSLRDSDNWQKGMPVDAFRKSLWRHFFDAWRGLRGYRIKEGVIWALCGILFNTQGLLHELLRQNPLLLQMSIEQAEARRSKRLCGLQNESAPLPLKAVDAIAVVNTSGA